MGGKIALTAGLAGMVLVAGALGQTAGRKTEADVLAGKRIGIPAQREQAAREIGALMSERRNLARARARRLGMPVRTVRKDGTVTEVVDVDDESGHPIYLTTHNANAAISSGAFSLRASVGLTGGGVVAGVWDGGAGRGDHQEFQGGRLVVRDGSTTSDHATHVAGTMVAGGAQASAGGMAIAGSVDSYDWNSDMAEMVSRAATFANEPGKIPISNHSYGFVRGWSWNGSRYVWGGFSGNSASSIETNFGLYGSTPRAVDAISHDAPYYLIFFSAGNERNNNPMSGSSVVVGGATVAYNPSLHPPGDGVYRGGYDTLGDYAVAKNVVTVGAVNDAVSSGRRDSSRATVTSFTSWGPTDDGRIKPDLVANGASVYSPIGTGTAAYASYSGTSMASPNAAGTAMLLVDHYDNLFPGQAMRASTLKGLLIHTADDRGRPGPDYQYGWGLVDGEEAATMITQHHDDPSKLRITEGALTSGEDSRVHEFVWDGVSPIKVTICWTDPEGSTMSSSDSRARNLVNDLNIRMIGPADEEFFPFVMPFVGTWTQASMSSNATTGVNSTDNVEQILVQNPAAAGVYRVFVTHGGVLSGGAQSYSLLVSGSGSFNTPPTISPLEDLSFAEDDGEVVVQFFVGDEESSAESIEVTVASENESLTGKAALSGAGDERVVTFTPTENGYGEAVITVTASDGELSSEETFTLSIFPVNDPPSLSLPDGDLLISGSEEQGLAAVFVYDVDNDPQELSLSISSANQDLLSHSGIQVSGNGQWRTISLTPADGQYGRTTVTATVSDGSLSTQGSFALEVANPHPSFGTWIEGWGIDGGVGPADDPDGDGLSNAIEYFHGFDPTSHDGPAGVIQGVTGGVATFDYRRSRTLNGVSGVVTWSTELGDGGQWSAGGVSDQLLEAHSDHDWRRATIPWPAGEDKLFIRLDISIAP